MTAPRTDDALNADLIREALSPAAGEQLREVTVLGETDSTNSALKHLPQERRHAHAVLAEAQTAGRGRRQRSWYSPAGGNIYLSLGWQFRSRDLRLSTLPLVTGLCLCRALERAGLKGFGVKWPNDILVNGKKVAGILVETQATGGGPVLAVIGVGLNVRMPAFGADPPGAVIDRPWTDLSTQLQPGQRLLSRNALAAMLLEELVAGLVCFEREGFEAFQDEWRERDLLSGKRLRLEGNGGFRTGRAIGIDHDGGLEVDIDGYGPQVLYAADVSVYDD
jgi:BirA family biotin operon repressor/biotin-[acetyl-CoA-carboxylase] ligase